LHDGWLADHDCAALLVELRVSPGASDHLGPNTGGISHRDG
jgi:hypothetical protein